MDKASSDFYLTFQLLDEDFIRRSSVCEVTNASTFERGVPKQNGVNDARMGCVDRIVLCQTCHRTSCEGHSGHILLPQAVLLVGHIKALVCALRCVCPTCCRPRFTLSAEEASKFPGLVNVNHAVSGLPDVGRERLKAISDAVRGKRTCPWTLATPDGRPACGAAVPTFSEVNKLFIERVYSEAQLSGMSTEERGMMEERRFCADDVHSILSNVSDDALRKMGFQPEFSHPRDAATRALVVLPPAQRPTIRQSEGGKSRGEDDLTSLYQEVVRTKNDFVEALVEPEAIATAFEAQHGYNPEAEGWWSARRTALRASKDAEFVAFERMQLAVSCLVRATLKRVVKINGAVGNAMGRGASRRKLRDLYLRLHGKAGRLRGTLAAKRTDFSARSVVSPDASHNVWELGVPASRMKVLTFPERVTTLNRAQLAARVVRGASGNDGAVNVIQTGLRGDGNDDRTLFLGLMDVPTRAALAQSLQIGWVVERHLKLGDWVLFNRQPTLHKGSIQAFRIYPVPGLSFRLPVPCTKPFNADYDGDEMNMHVLQGYQAVAEAQELMAVPHMMVTPQSNSVNIALVQETLVGAYVMTRRDALVDRDAAMQLLAQIRYAPRGPRSEYADVPAGADDGTFGCADWMGTSLPAHEKCLCVEAFLPAPAILKGTTWDAAGRATVHGPRWTGKQIMSWLLPRSLNLTRGVRNGDPASTADWLSDAESVVHIRSGELLTGRLCKATVGGTALGIVHMIWRDIGPWAGAKFVSDAQRLMVAWLLAEGVCISIRDCLIKPEVQSQVDDVVGHAMGKADAIMASSFPREHREMRVQGVLQDVIRSAGALALQELDPKCGLSCVMSSGAKGNILNIAQICAVVGQQTINGKRLQQRMGNRGKRSLACFPPDDERPEALGFVATSYIMGLTPPEYFSAMMAGREGIVAIAVETATSGYNQRRMTKNQESQVVAYDATVRVSSECIIQVHYNGDDYDGTHVERVPLPLLRCSDAALAEKLRHRSKEIAWVKVARDELRRMLLPAWGTELPRVAALPINPMRTLEGMRSDGKLVPGADTTPPLSPETHARWLLDFLQNLRRIHWNAAAHTPTKDDRPFLNVQAIAANDLGATIIDELLGRGGSRISTDRPESRAQCAMAMLLHGACLIDNNGLTNAQAASLASTLLFNYGRGLVVPGEGVGAVGASSIGEPSTQGALNVFHYSGIAGTNITTSGLPRFKQIINAVDTADSANMFLTVKGGFHDEAEANHFTRQTRRVRLSDVILRSTTRHVPLRPPMEPCQTTGAFVSMDEREALLLYIVTGGEPATYNPASRPPPLAATAAKHVAARGSVAWEVPVDEEEYADDAVEAEEDVPRRPRKQGKKRTPQQRSPCTHVVDIVLDKAAMVERGLTPWEAAESLVSQLDTWAHVMASETFEAEWMLRIRPLRTLCLACLSDADIDTLSAPAMERVHQAVASAMEDALQGDVLIRGLASVSTAIPVKVNRDVADVHGEVIATAFRGVSTLGSDLCASAMLPRVDVTSLLSNNIQEVCSALGIEAAVALIASELQRTLCFDSSYVDPRHPQLLADTQGRSGYIMALNCHNMEDLGSSLLQRASFERTLPVLEDAALFAKSDILGGATEKQIVGLPVHVGTGIVDVHSSAPLQSEGQRQFVMPLSRGTLEYGHASGGAVLPMSLYAERDTHALPPLSSGAAYVAKIDGGVAPLTDGMPPSDTLGRPLPEWGLEASWHPTMVAAAVLAPEQIAICGALVSVIDEWNRAALLSAVLLRTRLMRSDVALCSHLETKLQSFRGWDDAPGDGAWTNMSDVEYPVESVGIVHTLVDHSQLDMGHLVKNHIVKTRVGAWKGLPCGLEAAIMHEDDVPPESLPSSVLPTRVTLKQRKTFEHQGWAYVLGRWWSGETMLAAENEQRNGEGTWDVRIELWNPQLALRFHPDLGAALACRWWALLR
jgi:DNA-directed RNA polymerase beta' subunit